MATLVKIDCLKEVLQTEFETLYSLNTHHKNEFARIGKELEMLNQRMNTLLEKMNEISKKHNEVNNEVNNTRKRVFDHPLNDDTTDFTMKDEGTFMGYIVKNGRVTNIKKIDTHSVNDSINDSIKSNGNGFTVDINESDNDNPTKIAKTTHNE